MNLLDSNFQIIIIHHAYGIRENRRGSQEQGDVCEKLFFDIFGMCHGHGYCRGHVLVRVDQPLCIASYSFQCRSEESCRFGATSYLYYGGVFSLTINLLGLATSLAKWWALKVGKKLKG